MKNQKSTLLTSENRNNKNATEVVKTSVNLEFMGSYIDKTRFKSSNVLIFYCSENNTNLHIRENKIIQKFYRINNKCRYDLGFNSTGRLVSIENEFLKVWFSGGSKIMKLNKKTGETTHANPKIR